MATLQSLPNGLNWLAASVELDAFRGNVTDAHSDHDWILRYLARKVKKPTSRRTVQTEVFRFLFFLEWEVLVHEEPAKALKNVDEDVVERYIEWLRTPHPVELVSIKPVPRLIGNQPNPDWRPFRSKEPLSTVTSTKALNVLSGLYAWLVQQSSCPVRHNPFRTGANAIGKEKRDVDEFDESLTPYTKALSWNAYQALHAYLESDQYRGSEKSRVVRRWLVDLMYSTAVRVATFVELKDTNLKNFEGQWFLKFVTKNNAEVQQEWPSEMMDRLGQYRRAVGLSWPPYGIEPPYLWVGAGRSDSQESGQVLESSANAMLKSLAKATAQWVGMHGHSQQRFDFMHWTDDDTRQLNEIHAHSLRHSWCTHNLNRHGIPLLVASKHMGHSSVTITERYIARPHGDALLPMRPIDELADVIQERAKESGYTLAEFLQRIGLSDNHYENILIDPAGQTVKDVQRMQQTLKIRFQI